MNEEKVRGLILRHQGDRRLYFETGSAQGESALWAAQHFDRVVTIEFCEDNYIACLQRFWDMPNILVIRGDSGQMMPALEYMIREPAIVMLDAHYVDDGDDRIAPTGVTPVLQELDALTKNDMDNIIMIDDARLFGTVAGYPTVREMDAYASSRRWSLAQEHDTFIMKRLPL